MKQIPFSFPKFDFNKFDFFHSNIVNRETIALIDNLFKFNYKDNRIYLWGPSAVGKTHILIATIKKFLNLNKEVIDLSFIDDNDTFDLGSIDLFFLDDIDRADGKIQNNLFNIFNMSENENAAIFITGSLPPNQMSLRPDLRTRISQCLVLNLKELEDEEKKDVLLKRSYFMGINLKLEIIDYLVKNYNRNMHELIKLIEKIDKESIIQKKRITIPFIKSFME
ncbi:MAG: DnaA/Hda family protein [Hydrogenophilales bacterium]